MNFKRLDRVITTKRNIGIVVSVRATKSRHGMPIVVEFEHAYKVYYSENGLWFHNPNGYKKAFTIVSKLRNNSLTKILFKKELT